MTGMLQESHAPVGLRRPIKILAFEPEASGAGVDAAQILRALNLSWIAFTADGAVVEMSDPARTTIQGFLRVCDDGMIRALRPGDQASVGSLVTAAAVEPEPGSCGMIFLSDMKADRLVCLEGISLGPDAGILVLRDLCPDPCDALERHLLQIGLTPAEARVALRIGRGAPPAAVARDLCVTSDTVRSQLQSVFAKLGVSRQSELAVLVTRLEACARR
jgi:DNA-binding CsgD family transcriptional regulator